MGARYGPQDQGLSAEGRRGRIEGNVGAGKAAERKEGGRKGAREGRVRERLAEKGLREHGPFPPSPPAPRTSGRRVQGSRAWVLREDRALSVLGFPSCLL